MLVEQGLPGEPSVPMHLRLLFPTSCGLRLVFPNLKLLNDAALDMAKGPKAMSTLISANCAEAQVCSTIYGPLLTK